MNKRYEELDSLRGLAALSVFFGHIFLIFNASFITNLFFKFGPLRFLVAGSEAVTLFFLLSGFVLSLPYYSNKKSNYGTFLVKRICRIYLPYLFAIAIAYIAMRCFYTGKIVDFSNWFNGIWGYNLSKDSILDHIILIKTFGSILNPVVWSLVHEMRISIAFPFLMFFVVKKKLKWSIMFAILLSVISIAYASILNTQFYGTEVYSSVHFTSIFIIGALLPKYRENIKGYFSKLSFKRKLVLFITGFILFDYAHPSFVLNKMVGLSPYIRTVMDSWVITVGAAIIIICGLNSTRLSKFLRNTFINYIGKISYSLYLIHIPILFSCIHLFQKTLPILVIILIAILTTFVFSSLMYYLIEKPAILLGRNLTEKKGTTRFIINYHKESN